MRAVNLLPEGGSGASRPPLLTPTSVGVGGAVLVAVMTIALAVLFLDGHSQVSGKQHTLAAVEKEIATVQAETASKAAVASATAPEQGRVAAFDIASSARVSWDNLLDDVSRVLPAGAWLSSMSMQASGLGTTTSTATTTTSTSSTTTPTAFTVSGVAFSQDTVAKVMRRLALIPVLSDITLQSSTRADVSTTKAFQFSLTANVNAPSEVAR